MAEVPTDWAALYQRHRDAMYGVAHEVLRGTGRVDLAGDAVNEAFLSFMKSPPAEPPRSWEALLVATAKRRALDIIRSAAVRRDAEYVEENLPVTGATDDDEVLERLEKIARAKPVVARLSGRERIVLEQYVICEHPRAEVAAALGVSPARISQIATAVLAKIHAALEEGAGR
jgi:RNA polymerase sigma-70 factor (ECF subfamily)